MDLSLRGSSALYDAFVNEWNFLHVTSSPHYPQSNGLVEGYIQTVKNSFKKQRPAEIIPKWHFFAFALHQ